MDLTELKEAIGDEKFTELDTYVSSLISQRDQARNESISKRKSLQSEVATLQTTQQTLLEKLGLDSVDGLDDLPDAKGQGEALQQAEAKLKRLERELATANDNLSQSNDRHRSLLKSAAVSKALAGHEFIAPDLIEGFVSDRLEFEGDDLFYKTDDGQLVTVKDGVAGIAKSRPELLKARGTGGAGVGSRGAGSEGGSKTVTRAEFDAMTPQQRVEASKDGVTISATGG